MEKYPLIRAIYLYLFALVGLALLIIGSVKFLDMGLKAFVFTGADQAQRMQQRFYSQPGIPVEKMMVFQSTTTLALTEDERQLLVQWLAQYKTWQEESAKIDYVSSERQREASANLAMILVGFPLYLYHWSLIKRDVRKNTG